MSPEWRVEFETFRRLTPDRRVLWLSRAILQLSISARGSYLAGSEDVAEPKRLRRFNELIHRIAGRQIALATASAIGANDELFFELLSEATEELRVGAALLASLRSPPA
jgi:hypothetical protein